MPRFHLFDMPVDQIRLEDAVERVLRLSEGPAALVVTPNTDHFLRWRRDAAFRDLYAQAELAVLDGKPLVWLARLLGISTDRVTGVDLFTGVCEAAAQRGTPVVIVGGGTGVADQAAARLRTRFKCLRVSAAPAPTAEELDDPDWLDRTAALLAGYPEKVVAICLGSPKQEQLFSRLGSAAGNGAYLGVGAAADFISGRIQRAPTWMQRLGFEWLYRLWKEPRRLWRRYLVDDVRIARYFACAVARRVRGRGETAWDA